MDKYPDKMQDLDNKKREMKLDKTIDELRNELNKPIWKEIIRKSTE
ncbi:hypothetical protein [Aneurinibacillus aneurinilyticus]|uniref:Uncharacterized protein n=2 Tax=Aneurinibacillus aneurinilyticus TaxID=1391 RepID=A0A848CXE9_ANEAE|nr:hypothetical protein [Aneurinibacillus aneurinilyticus]ERI10142.1 hypothetical protein HMPREF0083_01756 [Aneurinibacillus aneurinilyticus ATCC 12856]MCI1692521.1 hypothetical protein [Aneurinibacillus aneurinilyticus]MED0670953.1 hypothetical protein [Aneurinibacillus aneurinilyticus]MED0705219.1 hypothetical protein [Aneurinibacillus aneurinilyticus]MED0723020.1 hypothetical protein [Aneurinibacillus aneurinilyticus]